MKGILVLMMFAVSGMPLALFGKADAALYKVVALRAHEKTHQKKKMSVDADRLSRVGGLTVQGLEKEKTALTVDEKDWLSSFATRPDALNLGVLATELALIGSPFFGIWWVLTDIQLAAIISFIEFKVISYGRRFEPSTLEQLQKKATELRVKLEQR